MYVSPLGDVFMYVVEELGITWVWVPNCLKYPTKVFTWNIMNKILLLEHYQREFDLNFSDGGVFPYENI